MSRRELVFLHGLESGPGGSKAQRLRANPLWTLTAPELPAAEAIAFLAQSRTVLPAAIAAVPVQVALAAIEHAKPEVVVGSSFGGGIAAALAAGGRYDGPLVLLAPAASKLFGITALPRRRGRVVVIHGRGDESVPADDSVQLAARSQCEVVLWLVEDDHRLKKSVAAGLMDEAIAWATR